MIWQPAGRTVEVLGALQGLSEYFALGFENSNLDIVEFDESPDSKFTGKFKEVNDLGLIGTAKVKMPDRDKGQTKVNMTVERQQDIAGAIARFTNRSGVTNIPLATQLESTQMMESPDIIKIYDEAYEKVKEGELPEAVAREIAADALLKKHEPLNSRQKIVLASVEHAMTEGSNSLARLADETLPQSVANGANVRLSRTTIDAAHQNIVQRLDGLLAGGMSAVAAGDGLESQGVWGHYIHMNGKQDSKDTIAGYEGKFNGITIGWDAELDDGLKPGFAFTYVNADMDAKDVDQSVKGDHYMGSFYVGWMDGPWLASGMLSYAQGKMTTRHTSMKQARCALIKAMVTLKPGG